MCSDVCNINNFVYCPVLKNNSVEIFSKVLNSFAKFLEFRKLVSSELRCLVLLLYRRHLVC